MMVMLPILLARHNTPRYIFPVRNTLISAFHTMSVSDPRASKVVRSHPLATETRWIGLRAIEWVDPSGKQRVWESADRKTRRGEVDGAL